MHQPKRNQLAFVIGMDPEYDDNEIAKTMDVISRMKGVQIVEPVMKGDDQERIRNLMIKWTLMEHMNMYFKNLDIKKAVREMREQHGQPNIPADQVDKL